ncbi:MAG: hypothetical protein RQ735_02450 [Flavobacteriaceae bacterium]|nr:hypothetical protein [Flavobacteriaceae bacterium]
MKTKLLMICVTLIAFFGCSSDDENLPECFQEFIEFVNERPPQGATIDKVTYKGNVLFAFSTNLPDVPVGYQDEACQPFCSSGGLLGETNCPDDFFENLEFVETVWTDPR